MTGGRRIAVVTSSRADYGLLRWTLDALQQDTRAELQLLVTGSHLLDSFGRTVDMIREDGFEPAAEIPMDIDTTSAFASAKAAGNVLSGTARALERLSPDLMLVLGDRFEILSAVVAASVCRVPVAHLHGGEVSFGSFDECSRHAISKLSRLHLTSCEEHKLRVLQMGEPDDSVQVVGAPGLENFARLPLDSRAEFEHRIGRPLGDPTALLVYHPATAVSDEDPGSTMGAILEALGPLSNGLILATGGNADPGSAAAMERLDAARGQFGDRLHFTESFGQVGFLSAMSHADFIIGNSSSGLIEAPSAGTPTINVGMRQSGRMRAPSVIDSATDVGSIQEAIDRALSRDFIALAKKRSNPFAPPSPQRIDGMGQHIANILFETPDEWLRAPKIFNDRSWQDPVGATQGAVDNE
ncbi:UDP-N-acetylglucosamine 2-epimerase [Hwanghaeella sp.]|uniref:UDP-N-acetylglucosamine 2-epimerase n=1 Tax=Hwanghaeella sp. TaxID=2605943 RepID=UPI003CCC35F5